MSDDEAAGLAERIGRQRQAQVRSLLAASFEAHSRLDHRRFTSAVDTAVALDRAYVEAIQAGILGGTIPDPQRDPDGWQAFVVHGEIA